MNKSTLVAAAVAGALGLVAVSTLWAQRPAAPPPSRGPVVVDTSAIAQNSVRLKQAMDALKADYKNKAEELKKEGQRGQQLTEEARKHPAGSNERKELEQQVLKLRADFELHGKRVNDDTREREMKIVYSLMMELNEELTRYAQANGQQLILRFDPTQADLSNTRAILAEIQRPIVYQRGADITPTILEALNRRAASPVAGRAPAGAPATGRAPAPTRNPVR